MRSVEPASRTRTLQALLEQSVSWWPARARAEILARDRAWIAFTCGACERAWDRVFRCESSPHAGVEGTAPLYLLFEDVARVLQEALSGRPAFVDADAWSEAHACECGAPAHHARVAAAALFHTVLGSGAGVVVLRRAEAEPALEVARVPEGGLLEAIEPTPSASRASLGHPLTLFESWRELVPRLPSEPGVVAGNAAARGVWIFAARDHDALEHGIRTKVAAKQRVIVELQAPTVRAHWPASLGGMAELVEAGGACALVVEREVLVATTRAIARGRRELDVRDVDIDHLELGGLELPWPIAPSHVALAMMRLGRTLPEACAHLIERAADSVAKRIEALRAMCALVPGGSFELEGTRATARHADGRMGRTLDVCDLPEGAALAGPELAREVAFLFDLAPAWADRTRVCPCGAPATVERKLIAWPWRGAPEAAPDPLQTFMRENGEGCAVVVALCCDRHVRVLAGAELERLGLVGPTLEERVRGDASSSVLATRARAHDAGGAAVVVARGPFVSGLLLDEARLAALDAALGRPVGPGPASVWAYGASTLALTAGEGPELEKRAAAAVLESGVTRVEFVLRREVDLSVPASGRVIVLA
ncbi:MAG: hypothetical protein IT378_22550 [Sandaracinaceae bacterium]|nr:hypothetical protein [Sandaracinaceae bacterium]